jgi:thioredoxin-related protein
MKLLILTIVTSSFLSLHWIGDINEAKTQAVKEKKLIMINFSGSDWCGPCIRLRKEILESATFENYAAEHLILVRADFPRQKKNRLDAIQIKKNEALADQYNPQGKFPFTLLLDENGKILRTWDGFPNESTDKFILNIEEYAGR